MLVLSRKINERIIIGENVELEVLAIRGGVARLGIKAPRDVSVVRTELSEEVISDSVKRGNSLCSLPCPAT